MKQKPFLKYFMKIRVSNFLKKIVNVDSLKGHDFVARPKPACDYIRKFEKSHYGNS